MQSPRPYFIKSPVNEIDICDAVWDSLTSDVLQDEFGQIDQLYELDPTFVVSHFELEHLTYSDVLQDYWEPTLSSNFQSPSAISYSSNPSFDTHTISDQNLFYQRATLLCLKVMTILPRVYTLLET